MCVVVFLVCNSLSHMECIECNSGGQSLAFFRIFSLMELLVCCASVMQQVHIPIYLTGGALVSGCCNAGAQWHDMSGVRTVHVYPLAVLNSCARSSSGRPSSSGCWLFGIGCVCVCVLLYSIICEGILHHCMSHMHGCQQSGHFR